MKNCKKLAYSIVMGLMVLYLLIMAAVCYLKVIELTKINIIRAVIPIVLLITCCAFIELIFVIRVNRYEKYEANEFVKFTDGVLSSLKSVTENQYNECDDLVTDVDEQYNMLKSKGCIFLFPEFKSCFDNLLSKMFNCGILTVSDVDAVDTEKMESVLKEEKVFIILAAQLIVRHPMLSIVYSKSMFEHIKSLSVLPIAEDTSEEVFKNAVEKLVRLLDKKSYSFNSWNKFKRVLGRSFSMLLKKYSDVLDKDYATLCQCEDGDEKGRNLGGLFRISSFKYHFIYDQLTSEAKRSIELSDKIIDEYKESEERDAEVVSIMHDDHVSVQDDYIVERGNLAIFFDFLNLLRAEDVLVGRESLLVGSVSSSSSRKTSYSSNSEVVVDQSKQLSYVAPTQGSENGEVDKTVSVSTEGLKQQSSDGSKKVVQGDNGESDQALRDDELHMRGHSDTSTQELESVQRSTENSTVSIMQSSDGSKKVVQGGNGESDQALRDDELRMQKHSDTSTQELESVQRSTENSKVSIMQSSDSSKKVVQGGNGKSDQALRDDELHMQGHSDTSTQELESVQRSTENSTVSIMQSSDGSKKVVQGDNGESGQVLRDDELRMQKHSDTSTQELESVQRSTKDSAVSSVQSYRDSEMVIQKDDGASPEASKGDAVHLQRNGYTSQPMKESLIEKSVVFEMKNLRDDGPSNSELKSTQTSQMSCITSMQFSQIDTMSYDKLISLRVSLRGQLRSKKDAININLDKLRNYSVREIPLDMKRRKQVIDCIKLLECEIGKAQGKSCLLSVRRLESCLVKYSSCWENYTNLMEKLIKYTLECGEGNPNLNAQKLRLLYNKVQTAKESFYKQFSILNDVQLEFERHMKAGTFRQFFDLSSLYINSKALLCKTKLRVQSLTVMSEVCKVVSQDLIEFSHVDSKIQRCSKFIELKNSRPQGNLGISTVSTSVSSVKQSPKYEK